MSEFDAADAQGLLRFGYKKMTKASYALLRVKHVAAAQAWLRSAPVTTAVEMNPPPTAALQVAFTAPGLLALGVRESVIAEFSHEFRGGMAQESRSRQLGDVDDNAPENWSWGGPAYGLHLVVMFFGEPEPYEDFVQTSKGPGWNDAFDTLACLYTSDFGGVEPFGFTDGVSQPEIDWEQQRKTPCTQLDYTNSASLGEFLLGYRNEYGKYTDRPLLDISPASAGLPPAEDAPGKKDLGRNGTYLVMRQLQQDVRMFWQFVGQQVGGDIAKAEKLAAAMVGRTRAGDPLEPIQEQPIAGIRVKPGEREQNRFTFDQDPTGSRCPFGAHVRRANPRNTDFPDRPGNVWRKLITMLGFGPKGFRDDLTSSVRFHRIVRRGREYGTQLTPEEALAPARGSDPERGLHFMCLNANIARQFEFLQNAWINSTKFSGLVDESDPLLGNRAPIPGCPVTNDFTIQKSGAVRRRFSGMPQFIKVRGGAYFFMPGIKALRYFGQVEESRVS
ncbi:MAG: peroxidase [Verrucomicrobia bacterium]|nr:peroxidase [Verrucomicrobiota bacterium]